MKKYYYSNGPDKNGSFKGGEILNKIQGKEFLIWTEGLEKFKPCSIHLNNFVIPIQFFFETKSYPVIIFSILKN